MQSDHDGDATVSCSRELKPSHERFLDEPNRACRQFGSVVSGRLFSKHLAIEINTSLESSQSPIFISVGFDLNRGQLNELEQVIVCAYSGANRFL